jgi:hypothetical protein
MDRVFENGGRSSGPPLHSQGNTPTQPPRSAAQELIEIEVRETHWIRKLKPWQLVGGGLACVGLLGYLGLWHGWSEARNDLRQERNLRLLEGIRSLGSRHSITDAGTPSPGGDGLPPPPPSEPWIEELSQLEGGGANAALKPLEVPLNGALQAPAPAASSAETPELVGTLQIPGQPGAAIFQLKGNSTNAQVGEMIGSTGWRLLSSSSDSAVIERGGEKRRVNISSGI